MAVKTLNDIYRSKGDEYIKNLLENYLIVSENISGSYFGVRRSLDGKVSFYKKDGEITAIDRILTRFYEKPINHLSDAVRTDRIPKGCHVGMKYVRTAGDSLKLYVAYVYNLKNDRYEHGRAALSETAEKLDVMPTPVHFEGCLDEDQKLKVLEFAYAPREQLADKFRTVSFFSHLMNVLNVDEYDEANEASSFILRFYEKRKGYTGKTMVAKIANPVFYELSKENEPSKPNDYIYLIIMDLLNFIQSYRVMELNKSAVGDDPDERYVALVNKIYKDFVKEYGVKYMDIKLDVPDFMDFEDFDLNAKRIVDADVVSYVDMNDNFKEIYKILLNFFRRQRKNTTDFLDERTLNMLNSTIKKISSMTRGDVGNGDEPPTFEQYSRRLDEEFKYVAYDSTAEKYKKLKGMDRVNVLIDNCQPLTSEHVGVAKMLLSKNGLKTVLVAVHEPVKDADSPLSSQTVRNCANALVTNNANLFEDVRYCKSDDMETIINALYPRYQPVGWASNRGRSRDYVLQYDYAKHKNIRYNLDGEFKIIQADISDSKRKVVDALSKGNLQEYKDLTPACMHARFFDIKKEYFGDK